MMLNTPGLVSTDRATCLASYMPRNVAYGLNQSALKKTSKHSEGNSTDIVCVFISSESQNLKFSKPERAKRLLKSGKGEKTTMHKLN